jgi:hypothetical protein
VFHADLKVDQAEFPRMTPLSGTAYLGAYYTAPKRSEQPQFQTLIKRYGYWDLIDVDALANTWPQRKWVGTSVESKKDAGMYRASSGRLVQTDAFRYRNRQIHTESS